MNWCKDGQKGKTMRLIDADALIKDLEYDVELDARALDDTDLSLGINRELVQFDKDCKQNAIDMLKKAPTVDDVQVIWCKDCKHFDKDEFCHIWEVYRTNESYCDLAEREEE